LQCGENPAIPFTPCGRSIGWDFGCFPGPSLLLLLLLLLQEEEEALLLLAVSNALRLVAADVFMPALPAFAFGLAVVRDNCTLPTVQPAKCPK
jgi:hypothetical protein